MAVRVSSNKEKPGLMAQEAEMQKQDVSDGADEQDGAG